MLIIGFIVAQIVLLVVIIVVLRRMIFSDTSSAINRLSKLDHINREREKTLARKLSESEKFVEEQRKSMQDTQQKMKQEARRAAAQLHEDIISKAKSESEEIIRKAQTAHDRMKAEAMVEAESRVIDLCLKIMGEVLGDAIQQDLNAKFVEEFEVELEKADLSKVKRDVNEVELVSARGVPERLQTQIQKTLSDKLGRQVRIYTREDHALVGGVQMRLGTLVVDASLADRFRETAEKMKKGLAWKYSG